MADIRDIGKHLESNGFKPCQPWNKRAIVSCGEKGKRYIAQIKGDNLCCVHRVDGIIIGQEQSKCDFLILVRDSDNKPIGESFIELKGKDIMHAVMQLEKTLQYLDVRKGPALDCRARIVTSRSIPGSIIKGDFERARVRFNKEYDCQLKRIKPSSPDTPAFGQS